MANEFWLSDGQWAAIDPLLEVHPGRGTVVANLPTSTARERALLLKGELEALVVEAKKLQMTPEEVETALREHWDRLRSDTGERSVRSRKGQKV